MKTIKGIVKSLKMDKTAGVLVERRWQHPLYKKMVKRSKIYACHYEGMALKEGDEVVIKECRPISKSKKFIIVKKTSK